MVDQPPVEKPTWEWTDKLALLVGGILALLAGFWLLSRRTQGAIIAGALLVGIGSGAVYFSTTVKGWCAPKGSMSFGRQMHWGQFKFHEPSFKDCINLVKGT